MIYGITFTQMTSLAAIVAIQGLRRDLRINFFQTFTPTVENTLTPPASCPRVDTTML